MAADLSRVRLNPLLDYSGVELKQGGVLLDADVNELVGIFDRRLRALASDVLGRATVSSTTTDAFKISVATGTLQIGKGRLYVDGLLAENHGASASDPAKRAFDGLLGEPVFTDPISYAAQPYLPSAPALPTAGKHLVYLDVWNRELTHLEQPNLVESAVAVETSSRLQTLWQVRVFAGDLGSSASCSSPDADLPGWAAHIAPSTGVLTTGTFDVAATDDPCELPPTGGYRGLENQLYRVEIHNPGQPGAGATFKWSRENASVGSRVASVVSSTELEVTTLGRDDILRFNTGDWVEITDDVRELSQAAGEMRRITVNEAAKRITFTPPLPASMLPAAFPDSTLPRARNLRVRRWDQKGVVFRTDPSGTPASVQDLDAASSTGVVTIPAGNTTFLLENGVTVSFGSTGAKGFKAGDHWEFAARTADASVEILDRASPRGIHHHYARLGLWDVAAGTVTDCRTPWPPASTGGDCACTVCVTPESHQGGQLTIQGAVDRIRETGGTICLHAGRYVLAEPVRLTGARSLRIHGQGPASLIIAKGSAFVVERSAAIAIDSLGVLSLGAESAIEVRSVLGISLRELVLAVFGSADQHGAGIGLSGAVLGATITQNLILAADGVRGSERSEGNADFLLTAALRIDQNALFCDRRAVSLAARTAHVYGASICQNEVLGPRTVGIAALGFALPGASVRLCNNTINAGGTGIRCAVDGAWIESNKLNAAAQGNRAPTGAGIALTAGLDPNGSDQCQVLGNQLSGYPDAGILIDAEIQELIVKLNIIERCGNGILMTDAARSGSLSIENNHLREIDGDRANARFGSASLGIAVLRSDTVTVAGNILRRLGSEQAQTKQLIAGILAFAVRRARIHDNEVSELGPLEGFGGAATGITVRGPFAEAEVGQNHVERDANASFQTSTTAWQALLIDDPRPIAGGEVATSRAARYSALSLDETRTLVLAGSYAWVHLAPSALDPAGAQRATGPSVSALGNVLIARGRLPAVDVSARGEVLFSDNRCELRANQSTAAVLLDTPVAIVTSNRVRGGEASIKVAPANASVVAIGNITTNAIQAPLKPEMVHLNLIA